MAEALVRHDELIADCVERRGGRFIKSIGEGDSTVSVFDSAPERARGRGRSDPRAVGRAVAERPACHRPLRPPYGRGGAPGNRLRRLGNRPRGADPRSGRGRPDHPFLGHRAAGGRASAGRVRVGRSRAAPRRRRGEPERIHAVKAADIRAPLAATVCPYRGLLPFEPEDRDYFFGREQVVEELIARWRPAGWWRSSARRERQVVAAAGRRHRRGARGRGPRFRHASLIRPGSSPELDLPDDPASLVVVDQFEELFTLCEDAARRRGVHRGVARGPGAGRDRRQSRHVRQARRLTPSSPARSPPIRSCSQR